MYLSQLRQLGRGLIPGAKKSVITNASFNLILNEGVKDIAAYTVCLKTNKKFNVVASTFEYNLSEEIGDYLTVDGKLWWNNGSKWQPVYPRTLKWLDKNRPNWRDLGEGNPLYYSIDSDVLTINPTPNTSLTSGFWLYYGAAPTQMTKDSDYPFGGETEYSFLSIFDYSIIAFARWRILPMISKNADADKLYQEYKVEREEKFIMLNRRSDLSNTSELRLQGAKIC